MRSYTSCFFALLLLSSTTSFAEVPVAPALEGTAAEPSMAAPAPVGADASAPQANGNGGTSANHHYVFPTRAELARYWVESTVGPKPFVAATLRASWTTWVSDSPKEWDDDFSGWSKRFGVSLLDN